MADDPIDLSGKGQPQPKGAEPAAGSQPKEKAKKSPASIYTRTDRSERAWERDLRVRLERTNERLVEWLQGRGDEELAEVFKEDGLAMTGGLIALARPVAWLRPVMVGTLTVVEPLMAFGRLARVMFARWADRRAQRAVDHHPGVGPDGTFWADMSDPELERHAEAGELEALEELDRRRVGGGPG